MKLLTLAQKMISSRNWPGRYMLAEIAAKTLGPSKGTVEGYIGLYQVSFDFGDQLQRLMYFNLYDQIETRLLHQLLKAGHIFLDVGANVGYYSLIASPLVGDQGQVHSFEPILSNRATLQQTITRNGITNIVVNSVAVGANKGSLTLYVNDDEIGNSGWASIVPSKRRPKTISVDVISIDEYLQSQGIDHVDLIKLDIEGAEGEALRGMKNLLAQAEAPDLLFEVNPYLLNQQNVDSRMLSGYLAEQGYSLFEIGTSPPSLIDPHQIFTDLVNLFGTKKPAKVEQLQ